MYKFNESTTFDVNFIGNAEVNTAYISAFAFRATVQDNSMHVWEIIIDLRQCLIPKSTNQNWLGLKMAIHFCICHLPDMDVHIHIRLKHTCTHEISKSKIHGSIYLNPKRELSLCQSLIYMLSFSSNHTLSQM